MDAVLLVDRFLSASSGDDVQSSLESLVDGLESQRLQPSAVFTVDVAQALLHVLQTSTHKGMPVDQGSSLVLRLYTACYKDAIILQEPLTEALLTVASDTTQADYPRVQCLQLLLLLCTAHSNLLQTQLLQAPNGLHQLAQLLDQEPSEPVRHEMLYLAAKLTTWPAVARNWMFQQVADKVILLATTGEDGGLTQGPVLVRDCLQLLQNMLQHDKNFAELMLESNIVLPHLTMLLDLRQGQHFKHPVKAAVVVAEDDDLDDLLSSSKKPTPHEQPRVVPYLTPHEELVLQAVLGILNTLLENDSVKHALWNQPKYEPLISLLWEMALLVHDPPRNMPFFCAVPSSALQQEALHVLALHFNNPLAMQARNGLDRLLFLVCTGGASRTTEATLQDQLALSQSALHVVRRTLTAETKMEMLLYCMAPPPIVEETANEMMDVNQANSTVQQDTGVVSRLLNTVFEQLTAEEPSERRKLLLAGATSALTLFLTDEASRSMLLRMTQEPSLLDKVLERLVEEDEFIVVVLLRFVAHWVEEAPEVIQALLQSASSSAVLSTLFVSQHSNVSAMTTLLLGLVMNDMGEDESKCGGWSRASIMEMMTVQGVSRVTSRLEAFKDKKVLPWSLCQLEWKVWTEWYNKSVLAVRRRLVQELTARNPDESSDAEDDVPTNMGSTKSLRKVVSQQADEIDALNKQLLEAQRNSLMQEKQLADWKKRLESNPTQLDELLNDYSSKNTELERQILALEEDVNRRDATIDSVQKELEEAKSQRDEARQECDSMRGELTALSHAYSSLEAEYRQQSIVSGAGSGEHDGLTRQQPEGEGSQQSPAASSTEVSMLRAENTRLRQDAKAADDWIELAVKKIKDLEVQEGTLTQEIESLKQQLEGARASKAAAAEAETEALVEHERQKLLDVEAQFNQRVAVLEQSLLDEQQRRQELDVAASQFDKVSEQLRVERLRADGLEQRLLAVQAQSESPGQAAGVEIEELRKELHNGKQEIVSLKNQLGNVASLGSADGGATDSSVAQVDSLKMELEAARNDFATVSARDQEEIYRCEARIRELEARLDGGLGKYTMEDIRKRDQDIAVLEKANEAAQEWMNNAVAHIDKLSSQVSVLSQENSLLSARIRELTEQANPDKIQELERRLQEVENELEGARSELSSREETIEQLRVGLDVSEASEKDRLAQLQAQVNDLTQQLSDQEIAANDVIRQWSESYTALELSRTELQSRLDTMESVGAPDGVLEELKAAYESKIQQLEELRLAEEKAAMDSIAGWQESYTALEVNRNEMQARLESLQEDLDQLRTHRSDNVVTGSEQAILLESQVKELKDQLLAQESTAFETISGWKESYDSIEGIRNELQGRVDELEARLSDATAPPTEDMEKQTNKISSLEKELTEALEAVSQWESRCTEIENGRNELKAMLDATEKEKRELQTRVTELERDHRAVFKELTGKRSSVEELTSRLGVAEETANTVREQLSREAKDAMESIAELQAERNDLQSQLDSLAKSSSEAKVLTNQVVELRSKVAALEKELIEASDAVSAWEESYNGVEAEKNELQVRLDAFEEANEPDERVLYVENDLRRRIELLETEKLNLERELASASDVVNQWEESYKSIEASRKELQFRLDALTAGDGTRKPTDDDELADLATTDLESKIKYLEEQLAQEEADAQEAISEWQNSYNALEAERNELQSRLDSRAIGGADKELAARVVELEKDLNEASEAICLWESSYKDVESARDELRATLEAVEQEKIHLQSRVEEIESDHQTFVVELKEKQRSVEELSSRLGVAEKAATTIREQLTREQSTASESIAQLQAEREDLQSQLDTFAKASSEAVGLTNQVAELRSRVTVLEKELIEASDSVSAWEESYDALEAEKNELQVRLDSIEEADESKTELAEIANEDLESKIKSLEEQLAQEVADAQEAISQWQESYHILETERNELVCRLDSSEALIGVEQEVNVLKTTVADLERDLAEASEAISQWEASYQEVENGRNELRAMLETTEKENSQLQTRVKELESDHRTIFKELMEKRGLVDELTARLRALENLIETVRGENMHILNEKNATVSEMEVRIKQLLEQLEQEEADAQEAISQWQESYHASEAELKELQARLDSRVSLSEDEVVALKSKVSELQEQNRALQKRTRELESDHQSAYEELMEKRGACNELATRLEASENMCNSMREETENLRFKLIENESSQAELQNHISELELEYKSVCTELKEARSSCEDLTTRLTASEDAVEAIRVESEHLRSVLAHEKDHSVLDSREVQEIRADLAKSNEAIERLEKERDSLRAELVELKTESDAKLKNAMEELDQTTKSADLAIDEWESRCHELEAQVNSLTEAVDASRRDSSAARSASTLALETEIEQLRLENASLHTERERLESSLQEREHDLHEAMNAVEFQITNTVSDKATALAAEALRKHVDELRSSLQRTQKDYADAHDAHVAAEEEIDRLREDLAALLGLQNTPETQAEVRRQAIHLKEDFQRKERTEIIQLKEALSRALDRLEASHDLQMAAEERASRACLQATLYEKDLAKLKEDLNFLTEKMDEMRQAESSQRESMEYRIAELQNENQVLSKQNASELDKLQSELSQANMARDQLTKALKESERSKESFFQTRLGREIPSSEGELQAEVNKLRVEKAHLLNSVAVEAAAVERRIREARAAAKSAAEAEIIVEREKRLSAEKALKDLKTEMMDTVREDQKDWSSDVVVDMDGRDDLQHELELLREQNASLAQEVAKIEKELQASREAAREERARLMEELRNAKTRSVQLEREGRQEAEFHTEMARLRSQANGASHDANPADDSGRDESIDVGQYYDETKKLNERLSHDRELYAELLKQHEYLLAVLAQQDLVRRTIRIALQRVGGKNALEETMMEVREKAVAEFGVWLELDGEKQD